MGALDTILLVEDDKTTRFLLREQLEKNDFVILEACAGRRCLEILQQYPVSLILLDLHLPDARGFEFIVRIKDCTDVPLVVLSSEQDIDKHIESFEIGADDFVSKPFHSKLLTARIRAHIRRYKQSLSIAEHAKEREDNACKSCFHGWTLDRLKFLIYNDNGDVAPLTEKEFRLLDYLVENADRVLRRDEICEAVREDNYVPTPRTVDVKITRIRKKIGDNAAAPYIIKTVRGVGYILSLDPP